jgi:hypothetical protein
LTKNVIAVTIIIFTTFKICIILYLLATEKTGSAERGSSSSQGAAAFPHALL